MLVMISSVEIEVAVWTRWVVMVKMAVVIKRGLEALALPLFVLEEVEESLMLSDLDSRGVIYPPSSDSDWYALY